MSPPPSLAMSVCIVFTIVLHLVLSLTMVGIWLWRCRNQTWKNYGLVQSDDWRSIEITALCHAVIFIGAATIFAYQLISEKINIEAIVMFSPLIGISGLILVLESLSRSIGSSKSFAVNRWSVVTLVAILMFAFSIPVNQSVPVEIQATTFTICATLMLLCMQALYATIIFQSYRAGLPSPVHY